MCCAVTILLIFGPRVAAIVSSVLDPTRWLVFDNLIVPVLGLIFLPWTLLAYVWLAPDGIGGLEWVIVVIAFLVDIGSLSGGAYGNRDRMKRKRG